MVLESLKKINAAFEKNALHLSEAKENGRKVMGMYCLYTPSEIGLAAGAIPVSLCGTRQDSVPAAEEILPRTTCALIKSSFGFALLDSCAYLGASDIVVADATCDGKKKMYEILAEKKPLLLLQLPQKQDEETSLPYWLGQMEIFVKRLEDDFGVGITTEKLREAIRLMNRERQALKSVLCLSKKNPPPLSGSQLVEICFKTSFFVEKEEGIKLLEDLAAEANLIERSKNTGPRILLTGVPVGFGSHKVVRLIEECGGTVVCLDNCTCHKKVQLIMDENAEDPLTEIARTYLSVPCACMSPNPNRYSILEELIKEFSADAVIDLTWQGCQTYEIESWSLKRFVQSKLRLPMLQLITDYSETDTENLKVRIEAFLEMIQEYQEAL